MTGEQELFVTYELSLCVYVGFLYEKRELYLGAFFIPEVYKSGFSYFLI